MIAVPRTKHLSAERLSREDLIETILLKDIGEVPGEKRDNLPEESCLVFPRMKVSPESRVVFHCPLNERVVVGHFSYRRNEETN